MWFLLKFRVFKIITYLLSNYKLTLKINNYGVQFR
jgi:hypothetical protein